MKKRWFLIPIVCLILVVPAIGQITLSLTERAVEKKYPVANISHSELRQWLEQEQNKPLLFDVRKAEEYVVGWIGDAIQVDPDTDAELFIKQYGDQLKDRDVVFYCSVGYRSSIFLDRVAALATAAGVGKLYNLRGGIFRWYNENNPVRNQDGETDEIHPYDSAWGALVVKRRK